MVILNSIEELLTHIQDVQKDVIGLSTESLLKISSFIENNNLEIDEDVATALQYQDIISQQLNATIEAIDSIKININRFSHLYKSDENLAVESMNKLHDKLNATLNDAKDKKDRFSGKFADSSEEVDEIEFF